MNKKMNVLFVGNSYTECNALWDVFANIVRGESIEVDVDYVATGGHTLEKHSDPADPFGHILDEKLTNNKYDVVFLQEFSTRPALEPGLFFKAVRKLYKKIIENGAKPYLYETWGRKEGSPDLELYSMTHDSMTQRTIAAYHAIGEELNIPISHAGTAFYDLNTNHPDIPIFHEDRWHASPLGTYVVALVHFATIYNISPIGIKYKFYKDDKDKQRAIEEAAHKAVFGPSILRDEYKISSFGVE